MSETLEHTARRIAEHGRDALLARLRPAFEEAAAAHRDALKLDDEQLEQMVQKAADRADGLQWRRALASVATEQLGIGLGEALSHPAVARAQAIVGAPSYEDALGSLGPERPADEKADASEEGEPQASVEGPQASVEGEEASEKEPDASEAEPQTSPEESDASDKEPDASEAEPQTSPEEPDASEAEPQTSPEEPDASDAEPEATAGGAEPEDVEPDAIRLRAVHLGGIANLAPAEGDLELHISTLGLDIVRNPDQVVLGRLTWDEIVALETPDIGGRFRRRRPPDAHLVIRSPQGSASFEIPGVTSEELREHLAPLLARR